MNDNTEIFPEENHMINTTDRIKSIYNELKENILSLSSNIQMIPRRKYISFTINNKNFVDVVILKTSVDTFLNLERGLLDDPKNLAKDVSRVGHLGNGDYLIKITNSSEFDYILSLIKQSFDKN